MLAFNGLIIAVSLIISVFTVLGVIKFSAKHNLYDSVNERKIHQGQVSRLGGIGFALPFILVGLFAFFHLYSKDAINIGDLFFWSLFAGSAIIYFSGLTDDLLELNAWVKLGLQICAALVSVALLVLGGGTRNVIMLFFSFCFILGSINSYNLIDGSDLLCSSLSIYTVFAFGLMLKSTNEVYFSVCLALCAGLAGFMFFNRPDAKIFMGDGGSQFLGAVISVLCLILLSVSENGILCHIICLNLVSIPIFDCLAAIWRRLRTHVGIFTADRFHMHHKLLSMGFTKGKIALLVSLIQIVISACAVFSWFWQDKNYILSLAVQFVVLLGVVVYFAVLHFTAHKANPEVK
ncbi:MAG: undecaprenyl/decaprenyl-phosphate alpha-N-acetylglucosaminyl 1-phosphate transferase [Treponema sp.]|nr:undecaprenyl/decaprenyl-phosphate alpha-N-acetylglucosaminyl 1-phosphate transferase [Treponema sp.]